MKKKCLLLVLLAACSQGQAPFYIEHANVLATRFSRVYQVENRLVQTANGGGMRHGIAQIIRDFESNQKIDVEEGRRLYIRGIELLCSVFNHDLAIRPYLYNYPFEEKNVRMMLSFKNPIDGQPYSAPYVSLIYHLNNKIYYHTYNPYVNHYENFYEEPYAEAVRIVHEEREAAEAARACARPR